MVAYIQKPAVVDARDRKVILPAGYLSPEEAQGDLVPFIVITSNGNNGNGERFSLDFDRELISSSCYSALALKKLSELILQVALRKAAKIMRNVMEEIGIIELIPVPTIGSPLSLEVQAVIKRDPESYRQILESVFLLEATVSYGLLDQGEIERFLRGMFKSYPWCFAPSTTLRVPSWVGPHRRILKARVISNKFFSTVTPWLQTSFLDALKQGDPCVLIKNGEDADLAKAYFYFDGEFVLEKTVMFSTAIELGKRFVRENFV